jgi:hypothetical protein
MSEETLASQLEKMMKWGTKQGLTDGVEFIKGFFQRLDSIKARSEEREKNAANLTGPKKRSKAK